MKNTQYLLIILLFNISMGHAQDNLPDTSNFYYKSFKLHVEYLKNQVNYKTMQQEKTIYIQADEQAIKGLPTSIYGYNIVFLNVRQIKEKARRDFLPIVVIRPVELKMDGFVIQLIDFIVSYKKQNLSYSNSGGSKLDFKYDCDKHEFVLKNKQQGGF